MRSALLLAVLVLLPCLGGTPAGADGEMLASPWVDLTGAHVLGSPGVPTALVDHLPEGRLPQPLTWPLPAEGPVLVLALPTHDDTAADIAEALGVWREGDDLGGGYRIAAWHDGERDLAVIVADDAAALLAARFELVVTVEPERLDPMMRTVELQMPAESGTTRARTGRRDVRPARAWRAWRGDVSSLGGPHLSRAALRRLHLGLAGAHVNRVVAPVAAVPATARALEGAGIEVVVRVDPSPESLDRLAAEVATLARDHGVAEALVDARRFADDPGPLLDTLASWPLDHVVISLPDADARLRVLRAGLASRLRGASLLVPGRSVDPIDADVVKRARAAGVDLVLDETWAAPSLASQRLVPLPPPEVPADRSDAHGILVTGAFGAATPLLEAAWDGRPAPDPEAVLAQPLSAGLALHADPLTFIDNVLSGLPVPGGATWRAGLREAVQRCRGVRLARVPIVPLSPTVDGQLGEPAWAHAVLLPGTDDVWAVSDGRRLYLAVRAGADDAPRTLALDDAGLRITIDAAGAQVTVASPVRAMVSGLGVELTPVQSMWNGSTLELALDRFDLGVDAHRGQVFGPFVAADGEPACMAVLP